MEKNQMTDISIAAARQIYNGSHIGEDILLFDDFSEVPMPHGPMKMNCILLGLCLKGNAQYSVDTLNHTVSANDIIIISEGQVVNNYQPNDGFSGIAIMLSDDFFHEIIKGIHELSSIFIFSRTHPVFTLDKDEVNNICTYFQGIKQKMDKQEHHFRRDVVRSLMMTMIYDLGNVIFRIQSGDRKQSRAEVIFAQFIDLVENNFREEKRVSWYAKQLCITPKYLSESVKQVSRRTPNEWIDNYVILEARVMLKDSALSIKEITQRLHFPNQSFFGKFFKEHVGMSPSKYRKS